MAVDGPLIRLLWIAADTVSDCGDCNVYENFCPVSILYLSLDILPYATGQCNRFVTSWMKVNFVYAIRDNITAI